MPSVIKLMMLYWQLGLSQLLFVKRPLAIMREGTNFQHDACFLPRMAESQRVPCRATLGREGLAIRRKC